MHRLVKCDRRGDLRDIASEVGKFWGRSINPNWSHRSQLDGVPRMLSEDQKRSRLNISRYLLSRYEDDPEEFMNQVVNQDETWIHHFDPESKMQNMQWKRPGSPPPQKFKRVSTAGKVMVSIFWDIHGLIIVDYLVEGSHDKRRILCRRTEVAAPVDCEEERER